MPDFQQYSCSETSPHYRVLKNICAMACGDPAETPSAAAPDPPSDDEGKPSKGSAPAVETAADSIADAAMVARRV